MFAGDVHAYLWAGLDAIRCIDDVLARTSSTVHSILDLPSGWGRVVRFLKVRFPYAMVTACDIVEGSAEYCAEHFGASAVRSVANFDELKFEMKFDLIFVGSLVTHLDEQNIAALLRMLARSMTPTGTLVITTLGDRGVLSLQEPAQPLPECFDPAMIEACAAKYHSSGYGFVDYVGQLGFSREEDQALRASRYGVCFTSPSWLEKVAADLGFRRVYFRAHGWDDLQDVHGFQLSLQ
jgi:SAM-dependent methyltransferase